MRSIYQKSIVIQFILMVAGMFLILYWAIFPFNTSTPNVQPYRIVTPIVKPGGILKYEADYCRFVSYSAQTTRTFVNALIYTMPTVITQHEKGCFKENISITVPPELPPGEYYLSMIYTYKVSPLQTITKTAKTEKFIVQ